MERRAFIGTLLAGVAGTIFADKTILWAPVPENVTAPVVASDALLTLDQITREALRQLVRQTNLPRILTVVPYGKLGEQHEGIALTQQYNVDFKPPDDVDLNGLDPERYITPVSMLLAERLNKLPKLKGSGLLELPQAYHSSLVVDNASGLAMRGIMGSFFDEELGRWQPRLRFDVLVGA